MSYAIMTVDDSASFRQMVGFTLEQADFHVVEAEHGRDALEKLDANPVDMIFADINMPEMDGIELIKEIRGMEQYRFLPIVMLTTECRNGKKKEGKDAGATGWILKPFTPGRLLKVVKRILG